MDYSGDEFYDDDVTSGVIDPPKPEPVEEDNSCDCPNCTGEGMA